jgi:hypothetical protein
VALKEEMGSGVVSGESSVGAAVFVCLGIFLLLYKRALVLGIAGVWGCVELL